MNKNVFAVFFGLLLSGAALAQTAMPVVELTAGFHRIEAEVAATDQNRQTGLMQRKSMPAQRGMLFVFPQPNAYCMWMRNTLIPLSVAFLDAEGKIINIEDMQPQTEDNHCAKKMASYALEMNLGWFAQRGLKAGTRLNGIEKAPRGQ
ncbi:DUF192 domain-containing protein [Quatrionicoccus australiensis]|uniref:DUF192 domain-containing protein n=1 Tax=Quatrionicoccus australiensis TaxID=138118 RepID=UPI001CFB484D|nr:DUF192 domain-containing protein [Quatrionicoccus australiensis]MCB4361081.1 DUF192 domain-containing protein [Quatrionicoccus australiensis]